MILMAAVLALVAVAKVVNATFGAPDLALQADRHLADLRTTPFFSENRHEDNDA